MCRENLQKRNWKDMREGKEKNKAATSSIYTWRGSRLLQQLHCLQDNRGGRLTRSHAPSISFQYYFWNLLWFSSTLHFTMRYLPVPCERAYSAVMFSWDAHFHARELEALFCFPCSAQYNVFLFGCLRLAVTVSFCSASMWGVFPTLDYNELKKTIIKHFHVILCITCYYLVYRWDTWWILCTTLACNYYILL